MVPTSDAVPSAPAKASLIEDFFDIWYAPAAVFTRRREGAALGPFLVSAVSLVALYYLALGPLQGFIDTEVMRAVAEAQKANPNLTGEQVQGMQRMVEGSIKYGGLVILPITLVLLGALTWLVAKLLGGSLSFAGGLMIASFAYVPKMLDLVLVLLQSLVLDTSAWTGRYQFSLGLGRFWDSTGPQGIYNLVGRVDVFTLWATALFAIGLVHAGRVEKGKAYLGAAIIWVCGAIPALIQVTQGK